MTLQAKVANPARGKVRLQGATESRWGYIDRIFLFVPLSSGLGGGRRADSSFTSGATYSSSATKINFHIKLGKFNKPTLKVPYM